MEPITEENEGEQQEEQQQQQRQWQRELKIARGGPIYIPNFVSPLTSIPQFQSAILRQLQTLETQLCFNSPQLSNTHHDISVDDLKIITEEDLVRMALKEAFKDEDNLQTSLHPSKDKFTKRKSCCTRKSSSHATLNSSANGEKTSVSCDETNEPHSRTTCDVSRKRRRPINRDVEGDYTAKVEEFAKIKQKQDEDKAAAKLHSLNTNRKMNKGASASSETIQRMKSLRSIDSATKQVKSSTSQEHRAVLYPEVVLCIEVYHTKRKWIKTQELMVLGCQTLAELRDKINCLTDQVMQKAGEHDSSGYFLIENVFYNDLRDPSAIDYSEPIRDWLRNSKEEALKKWEWINLGELQQKQKAVVGDVTFSDLPNFRAFEMHKIRCCDLKFRLGAGYLYCHQGACEHVIVFRDMRLIHPDDEHNRAAYPIVIFELKVRARKCNVCNIYRATKVTVDDRWTPNNPCYFCDVCFSLLHYKDGQPYVECVHL